MIVAVDPDIGAEARRPLDAVAARDLGARLIAGRHGDDEPEEVDR